MSEPTTSNKAFRGAYRRGHQAGMDGKPLEACPYRETRGGAHGNIVTFSRAFRAYWFDGHADGLAERTTHGA